MKFVFDNNMSPLLARAIRELSKTESDVEEVIHLRDRFEGSTKDVEWLAKLAEDRLRWYVVSQDKFKKNHRAEREAISRAGHTVYVLHSQWSSWPHWDKAANLVRWWPLILQHARIQAGGVFSVPWKRTTKSKFEAI